MGYLFRNLSLLEPEFGALQPGMEIRTDGEHIAEVGEALMPGSAEVVDCGGRVVMPGLIDSHVHVMLSEVNTRNLESVPLTLGTARAAANMRAMLNRGFTTVRDTGGADWGIKQAVEEGSIVGPRLFIAGQAIGPTGGHSDPRRRTDVFGPRCHCCNAMAFTMCLSDGVSETRKAAREQMRQGADQVKIMMSGGVASPYDPLDSLQFSDGEIAAAVEEAHAFGRYVCAHAYTPKAITRAAHAGVRTIEHGNLIDDASAKLMAEKGMFLIANLVAYYAMKERAADFGMNKEMLAKNDLVIDGGLRSLDICKQAGVPVAYGSDLLGQLQVDQSREFLLRREVLSNLDIIRSATTIGAQITRTQGKLGTLKPGAYADLLVLDSNPLDDLAVFQDQGAHMAAIMKGGRFHSCRLH
jgi:imidazolonepropionase-like amidohydrolase